jgi:hypothetical protein
MWWMRIVPWLAFVPAAALAFIACVGDDAAPVVVAPPDEAGTTTNDGSTTSDGASGVDGNTPLTDGGGGGDADAGPPCGYPGEACCAAPLTPCQSGSTCSTAAVKTCLVSDAWAVGVYAIQVNGMGFPQNRTATAHYDGSTWTRMADVPTDWSAVSVYQSGPSVVHVISNHNNDLGGKYFYLSGATWKECGVGQTCIGPLLSNGKNVDFYGLTQVDGEFWLGGVNQIYRCASGASSCTSQINGLTGTWASGNFAGTTATDLWYSAIDRAFHYDGVTWTVHPNLKARSIYQVRKGDAWVGDQTLQHWNGTAWSAEYNVDGNPAPGYITSISGSASDDLWAAGDKNGTSFAAHWNGTAWSLSTLPAAATGVQTIWAPSKSEAFVVGGNAGIFKWNGTTWTQMTSPPVTATAPDTTLGDVSWVSIHGLARPRP